MHKRGSVETMHRRSERVCGDVALNVGAELQAAAERAMAEGIEAWRIILDPGIGFSKAAQGNCELIAGLPRMRACSLKGEDAG